MSISIQQQDFNLAEEYQRLRDEAPSIGAIVTFSGLVREFDQGKGRGLYLEHYPAMTSNTLENIIRQAQTRWPITNARIVHRIGKLSLGEQIVFVGVNSPHREAAFRACEFIMDFLKTQAPFWKKALTTEGEYWVEAKDSDFSAGQRWGDQPPEKLP